ncbi:MAG: glycosyltransferase family 4 protein [Frankiaceae bacterium]
MTSHGRRRLVVMSAGRILGGAELSLLALATRLPAHGWEVLLTCPPGPLAARAGELGVPLDLVAWRTIAGISDKSGGTKRYRVTGMASSVRDTARNGLRLSRLLRSAGATAVLSNSLPSHLVVALAGRLAGVPPLWYLREIVDPGPGRRVLEAAGRSVPTLLSISRAVTGAIRHPRVVTIPEPVEAPESWPPRRPLAGRRPLVGYLGRLDPRKGVEDVCHAAGSVDADFLVAGAPHLAPASYAGELAALAEAEAPGRVRFVGAVPSPWELLAGVDVLVVPSRREPWGRVAAEALMSGVPVVAAGTGGLPEIVRDGVDGLLYPPGDVPALVARLHRLLGDPALHERLAAGALAGAHRFDPSVHARHVAAALDGTVDGTLGRAAAHPVPPASPVGTGS